MKQDSFKELFNRRLADCVVSLLPRPAKGFILSSQASRGEGIFKIEFFA
jgi:hypothetical protein